MTIRPRQSLDTSDIPGAIRDLYTATNGITAFDGGGQADATPLTSAFNRVTVVATADDSVRLPPAVVGASVYVKNAGAESLDVFPSAGQAINALAADAAFAVASGASARFVCVAPGVWDT